MKEIVYLPEKELVYYDRNPHSITHENIKKLVESMEKDPLFLEARPLLVNNRTGQEYCLCRQ
jgi:hypothetical protein